MINQCFVVSQRRFIDALCGARVAGIVPFLPLYPATLAPLRGQEWHSGINIQHCLDLTCCKTFSSVGLYGTMFVLCEMFLDGQDIHTQNNSGELWREADVECH